MTHRSLLAGGDGPRRPRFGHAHVRGSMSVRRMLYSLATLLPLLLALQATTSPLPAGAVDNTGTLCMDGNIEGGGTSFAGSGVTCGTTAPPYHWSDLFNASGTPILNNASLLASVFVPDYATPDPSYFTQNGAGVKDTDAIANWGCKTQNTPTAKDDVQNAFGAVFRIAANAPENANDIVAYLGVERLSNVGDSFAGFWLFKDPSVSCSGNSGFTGHHTDGDILILTNFTNGGSTAAVDVFKWVGDDATGAPQMVTLSNGGNVCGVSPGGTAGDSVCAVSNAPAPSSTTKCTDSSLTIASPWAPTSVPGCTFTEAAIDLTQLFGGTASGPCFSNFMAETRSSQQITATLKDFAGGLLNTCVVPPVATTASGHSTSNLPGSAQHDTATMSSTPTPTGTVTFFLCGPTQVTSAGCPSGAGTQVGSAVSLSNGSAQSTPDVTGATTPNDLATGQYCWGAQYTPDTNSEDTYLPSYGTDTSNECFSIAKAQPTLSTVAGFSSGTSDLSSSPALSDTVTMKNAATGTGGVPAGESVTFSLFGPYGPGVTPTCATGNGQPVFTTTGTLSASGGNFVASTSTSFPVTQTGTYVWTVSYGGDTYNNSASEGCNGDNESATISTPLLHITKTADNATVSAGSPIGFTITVSNGSAAGTGTATGVTVSDPLPGGTGVHWSIDRQDLSACTVNATGAQTLSCSIASLAPGATYSVHVTSGTTASSCKTYNNTATASADNQTAPNVQASDSTTVQCPNVSVLKTADSATVNAGDPMNFTVVISNSAAPGTGTATNVVMSDPLPSATGVSWSISGQDASACTIGGLAGGQHLDCTIARLAPGDTYTVHITSATDFASCTQYQNTASVTVGNENGGPFTSSATITVQCPGLQIVKTTDTPLVNTGSDIHFAVTVSNSGPGTADNVTVDDPLPAGSGVDWSIAAQDGTLCAINGNVGNQDLQCSLGDMAPGATYHIHITSSTTASSAGTYPNTATAAADNAPSVNASATVVVIAPDVTVTKTADSAVVDAGSSIGFTVTITNSSAQNTGTATGVTVADPLPMGTGINWTIDQQWSNRCMITATDGGTPGQELDCMAFTIAPGASYAVHITSTTEFQSCAVYTNTATVMVSNQSNSPVTSNTATTTVQCPDLGIVKTADATPVNVGTSIGFSVSVSNGGPGTANDVTVDDPLPSGNGVNWSIDSQDGTACQITTVSGHQDLTCALGDMPADSAYNVHITSDTTVNSAGTYPNTATVSSSNAPTQESSATIVVLAPALSITKTADASPVAAGGTVGFTVTIGNSDAANTGTATTVSISDPLPAGNGVDWSISPAYTGPGTCSVAGSAGSQTLNCSLGDMKPGASASVHITSSTTSTTCSALNNTATVSSTNAASQHASAAITMTCVSVLGAAVVVPATGAGTMMLGPAGALIASGIMLIVGVFVRRRRTRG